MFFFSLFLAPKEFCFCHTKNVIFQLSNADLPLIFMKPAAAAVHKRALLDDVDMAGGVGLTKYPKSVHMVIE